jgi:hypothetical protein
MNVGQPFGLARTIDMHKNVPERRAAAVLLHAHTVTQVGVICHMSYVMYL